MTTVDLTEFLLARVAEDEARAPDVLSGPHLRDCGVNDWESHGCDCGYPTHVLAECEAKRRIVELHRPRVENVEWFDSPTGKAETCPSCHPAEPTDWNPPVGKAGIRPEGFVASYVLAPCPTLRLLALPHADHPDFDEAWRP